ncbi:hypothetical protein CERZMDRAFT_95797 [Cercospora zeae-maydis SCOH1-5]|uniref:Uncharacterized protein n=1 Tax=Cercospora zeae-maydis SCOH1-5 TaxID=717836 RepID=A0A6A6FMK8_9PEZI|nr:hypothetical protein CERZMDRAFT_95797 [Cercospora zeae-maydis SCOH1-5]
MGNAISSVLRDAKGSEKSRREMEDVLSRLVVLAEVKASRHYHRVSTNPIDEDILPVDEILRRFHVAHCCVKRDAGAARDVIEQYLGRYLKPEIIEGLTAVITETLDRLMLSTSTKNSSEITSYAITIGKAGGIGRIDCYMFYYKFQSPDLSSILDNCLVTSLIVSAVSPSKLHFENLSPLAKAPYSSPLPGESNEKAGARLAKIENMLLSEMQANLRKRSAPI